jgi:ferredoxin
MKIRIDRGVCAGHALCAVKAPEVYRLDDEGYCCSDGDTVPVRLHAQARLGAQHCPEAAIFLDEDDEAAQPPGA